MNMKALLNQFSGNTENETSSVNSMSDTLGKITSQLPGGLAGGAVAGGIMSLIMTSKSARKVAGTAATYGGAALLGGLAYKAYKNWQAGQNVQAPVSQNSFTSPEIMSSDYQLTLIKGMIGAARADGHIDAQEQKNIYTSIDQMDLSTETKAMVFDLIRHPVSIEEIASGAHTMEQKTELYLVSSMVIDADHPAEKQWLNSLASLLGLPEELALQLQLQAQQHAFDA
ncbi:MAG: tellurite resistance TerB family protein [Gammaproteobacteria bacterium]|nr:tellurite resistance TerB family protein [Gammaproteobacteria bacterium]